MGAVSAGRGKHQTRPVRGRVEFPNLLSTAPNADDFAFCDLTLRLYPRLNYAELLTRIVNGTLQRRGRIQRLQKKLRAENYHVPSAAVARALLRDIDPGWLA